MESRAAQALKQGFLGKEVDQKKLLEEKFAEFQNESDEDKKLILWDKYMAQKVKVTYKPPDIMKNAKQYKESQLLNIVQKGWKDKNYNKGDFEEGTKKVVNLMKKHSLLKKVKIKEKETS